MSLTHDLAPTLPSPAVPAQSTVKATAGLLPTICREPLSGHSMHAGGRVIPVLFLFKTLNLHRLFTPTSIPQTLHSKTTVYNFGRSFLIHFSFRVFTETISANLLHYFVFFVLHPTSNVIFSFSIKKITLNRLV